MPVKEKEIDWSKVHPWHKTAYDFGVKNKGWFAVKAGSKEHAAWATYFQGLGYTPAMFRAIAGDQKWTAPCQWPEWMATADSADKSRALAGSGAGA